MKDKARARRGIQALSAKQVETVIALKKEVPERSLDRVVRIAEQTGLTEPGVLRRSTLHRVLRREGISGRPKSVSDTKDLDRFEALAPNDLWQSDMRTGPWLPDPERPGKVRRAQLFCFLDDHSRKLLAGRFSFAEGHPDLEMVFGRSLEKYGKPTRVYYDNGKVYRAGHMRHIVATLGIHAMVFTQEYRPEGHGKIEAFNRLARSAFVAEVKASRIQTIKQRREEGFVEAAAEPAVTRQADDDAVVALLREHLDPGAFDEATARDFLHRYGPLDPRRATVALENLLSDGAAEHHVTVYLEAVREALR